MILPVVVLIGWQIAGNLDLISKNLLPTPCAIGSTFVDLAKSGDLL
ncbi:hypothetical protein GZH47_00870 [Paenibacillus rhizovicinus]|uniref:Uncharacterized protein n=1 Tax=Paenibacillus rhizovicinus TaxID=2704463 RepID=A0A6C0NUC8_9BACL|nr:hypothetical protein [Paenibacillus rhizovicinus]QHW29526.1 hypothetical protein GZH47_00870 [Paenibacillus rhizovicinus]